MIVLEIIIARLSIIAEPEWVITGFETRWVVTALKRGKAYEISSILLLELEEDIEKREKTLFFPLYFLLETRVKATSLVSSILTAILILEENVETRSEL